MHIKNAVSDCFRGLKITAPKSPDNLLVWSSMTELFLWNHCPGNLTLPFSVPRAGALCFIAELKSPLSSGPCLQGWDAEAGSAPSSHLTHIHGGFSWLEGTMRNQVGCFSPHEGKTLVRIKMNSEWALSCSDAARQEMAETQPELQGQSGPAQGTAAF